MRRFGPHIEATIRFLTSEEGGRKSPAFSGYRPQFFYEGQDWDAEHQYIGADKVNPGDTVTARLTFLSPDMHRGRIHPGMTFEVREGAKIVARGKVTRLLGVESEIRQLLRVARLYFDEANVLAADPDAEFQELHSKWTMDEFAWLFRELEPSLSKAQDQCVRLVAHLDSAAVRLETIMECLFKDLRDNQVGSRVGEQLCATLRHRIAHHESYPRSDKDQAQDDLISRLTAEQLLRALSDGCAQIETYLVEIGVAQHRSR